MKLTSINTNKKTCKLQFNIFERVYFKHKYGINSKYGIVADNTFCLVNKNCYNIIIPSEFVTTRIINAIKSNK